MKKVLFSLTLITVLALSACNLNHRNGNTSIASYDNAQELNFESNFNEGKTKAAQDYIEGYLKENRIFKSASDLKESEIILVDGTKFYIKYEPGFISINLEKKKNSFTSYNRMKKMISGFAAIVKD